MAPWVSGDSRRLPVAEKMAIEQPSDDFDSVTTVTPFDSFVTCTQRKATGHTSLQVIRLKIQVTPRYRSR